MPHFSRSSLSVQSIACGPAQLLPTLRQSHRVEKKHKSDSSAEQPAALPSSAAESVYLPLRELSKRSGQFRAQSIFVQQAQDDEYDYLWQGQKKNGKTFSCILVSSEDPSEYCIGQTRWTKKDENEIVRSSKSSLMGSILPRRKSLSSAMPRSSPLTPLSNSL